MAITDRAHRLGLAGEFDDGFFDRVESLLGERVRTDDHALDDAAARLNQVLV